MRECLHVTQKGNTLQGLSRRLPPPAGAAMSPGPTSSPADASSDELIGATIAGRYRVISRVGVGGMGVAYRAWDERTEVPVVVKIPKRIFFEDPQFAERFAREIRLLQGLSHPHIVPIVDVGEHQSLPFVAMRFLPGGSLSNRRLRDKDGKPLPNPPAMLHLWLPAVAAALDHVHASGVVHRDVKPANIFFDAFWEAFLGDFGIAKIVGESGVFDKEHTLTATHMGIGTQEYMAPEQFTPKAVVDGRADQYALAVCVYELVAGSRPFRGEKSNLIVEVMTQPAPPLAVAERSLAAAVQRALSKRPEERFAGCAEFAAAALADVAPMQDKPGVARLLCPKCGNMLKLPVAAAGRKGACPRCKTSMKVAADLGAMWLLDEAGRHQSAASQPTSGTDVTQTLAEATPVSKASPVAPLQPRRWLWLAGIAAAVMAAGGGVALVGGLGGLIGRREPVAAKPNPPAVASPVKQALKRLKDTPQDVEANRVVGHHRCFEQGDWEKGLVYLAKAGAAELSATARKELLASRARPVSPTTMLGIARSWWTLAGGKAGGSDKADEALRNHARDLYLAHVEGLAEAEGADLANRWLDEDAEFRALVSDKRPPHIPPATVAASAAAHDRSPGGRGPVVEQERRSPQPPAEPHEPGTAPPMATGTVAATAAPVGVDESSAAAAAILAQPPLRNSVGIELKLIPAGRFLMGWEGMRVSKPVHEVRITTPFYMGVYEVTNAQWRAVMGSKPPGPRKDEDLPVAHVRWDDAMQFCQRLSTLPAEQGAGRIYRLPTEAEWEYACRAGTTTRWSCGDDEQTVGDFAWSASNSGREVLDEGQIHQLSATGWKNLVPLLEGNGNQTHPVGRKRPNPWGLFDMHGNVWEWCNDWFGDYASPPIDDPFGPAEGLKRVGRGGGILHLAHGSGERYGFQVGRATADFGFRVAMTKVNEPPAAAVARPEPTAPPKPLPPRAFRRTGGRPNASVDAAVAAYNEAVLTAVEAIAEAVDKQFEQVKKKGTLDQARRYEEARTVIASGNFLPRLQDLPKAFRIKYDGAVRKATKQCFDAYEEAVRACLKSGDLAAAEALRTEAWEFLEHPSHRPLHVPPEALAFRGHWYQFSEEALPFEAAFAAARRNEGYLVVIDNAEENEFVQKSVRGRLLLGMLRVGDVWLTADRKPCRFFRWDDGQPSNGEEEFMAGMFENGKWHDFNPETMPYCIEWD